MNLLARWRIGLLTVHKLIYRSRFTPLFTMKMTSFLAGCLTILGSVTTTLSLGQVQSAADQPARVDRHTLESVASGQSTDEFASINNEPYFPGGQRALEDYFGRLALYAEPTRIPTNRTVKVLFRVMPTGRLTELRIVQSGGTLLDQAVLEAVSQMPRWFPAHRAGVSVSSLYLLPVRFGASHPLSARQGSTPVTF